MKNRFLKLLTVILALALLCGFALAEVRTTASVNLRSGPGLSYSIVTSYPEGKSLEYLGESSTDDRGVVWYKVSTSAGVGWVSSRYSELKGESAKPAATAAPTAAPTARPTAAPANEGKTSLPALSAGGLFADSLSATAQPAATTEPTEGETLPLLGQAVELSNYYRWDLVTAANELGLISYRQVESEVPYQYYNDALILAGNQNVENIVVFGDGYEVYGVHVGMTANAAMACMNAAKLDYVSSVNGLTYEHRAAEDAPFADENGHDSCINLWVNEENIVTEIDWSTYTG